MLRTGVCCDIVCRIICSLPEQKYDDDVTISSKKTFFKISAWEFLKNIEEMSTKYNIHGNKLSIIRLQNDLKTSSLN